MRKNERREEGGSDFVFTTDLYNLCCMYTSNRKKLYSVVMSSKKESLEKKRSNKLKLNNKRLDKQGTKNKESRYKSTSIKNVRY